MGSRFRGLGLGQVGQIGHPHQHAHRRTCSSNPGGKSAARQVRGLDAERYGPSKDKQGLEGYTLLCCNRAIPLGTHKTTRPASQAAPLTKEHACIGSKCAAAPTAYLGQEGSKLVQLLLQGSVLLLRLRHCIPATAHGVQRSQKPESAMRSGGLLPGVSFRHRISEASACCAGKGASTR